MKGVALWVATEIVLYNNINSRSPACIDQLLGLEKSLINFVWPNGKCCGLGIFPRYNEVCTCSCSFLLVLYKYLYIHIFFLYSFTILALLFKYAYVFAYVVVQSPCAVYVCAEHYSHIDI